MKKVLSISLYSLLVVFIVGFSFASPEKTQAQADPFFPNAPEADKVTLNVFPNYPAPKQQVNAGIQSFAVNLDQSTVSWYVNGQKVSGGIGQTTYTFIAPDIGGSMTLKVVVNGTDGQTYTESTTIKPATVDLLWEAHTYTPPFYKGKALFSYQGSVTVVAMPVSTKAGTMSDPKKYIYTWKQDGTALGNQSGYGKNTLTLAGTVITRPIQIAVTVTTGDGQVIGTAKKTIAAESPEIVLYEDNPLYGTLYNQALNNITLSNSEIQVKAAPYFFSTPTPHNPEAIQYAWKLNNIAVSPQNDGKETIILRKPTGISGTSVIALQVTSTNNLLQFSNSTIQVSFTK